MHQRLIPLSAEPFLQPDGERMKREGHKNNAEGLCLLMKTAQAQASGHMHLPLQNSVITLNTEHHSQWVIF